MYCDRSQKTSQRVKYDSQATRLHLVLHFLFFTRCDVICDLLQYTRKNVKFGVLPIFRKGLESEVLCHVSLLQRAFAQNVRPRLLCILTMYQTFIFRYIFLLMCNVFC